MAKITPKDPNTPGNGVPNYSGGHGSNYLSSELRENVMIIATGQKSVGKTHQTKKEIISYVMSDQRNNRAGRKVLILDTNNEYKFLREEDEPYPDREIKTIYYDASIEDRFERAKYIREFNSVMPRRIVPYLPNGRPMSNDQLKECCMTIAEYYRGGMWVLEDPNKFFTNTKIQAFIGLLVSLRHVGVDLYMHLQSSAKMSPDLWENVNYVRMHKESTNIERTKAKVSNPELFRIAQLIINRHFDNGHTRHFMYVGVIEGDILRNCSGTEFKKGCEDYLTEHPNTISRMTKHTDRNGNKVYPTPGHAIDAWTQARMNYLLPQNRNI